MSDGDNVTWDNTTLVFTFLAWWDDAHFPVRHQACQVSDECEHEGGIVSCYIITITHYISHTIRPKMMSDYYNVKDSSIECDCLLNWTMNKPEFCINSISDLNDISCMHCMKT
jgi:hypothetical protein